MEILDGDSAEIKRHNKRLLEKIQADANRHCEEVARLKGVIASQRKQIEKLQRENNNEWVCLVNRK